MKDDEGIPEVELLGVSLKKSTIRNNEDKYDDEEFEIDDDDDNNDDDYDMTEVRRTMEQQLLVDCK